MTSKGYSLLIAEFTETKYYRSNTHETWGVC
jgi:hypothetical protein